MSMSLYVMTHKIIKNKFPKDRKIMLVGAFDKVLPQRFFSDCGEKQKNISNKNYSFCELTGLYFMVQNDDAEILGLEHYRRLFFKRKFFLFKYPFLKQKDIEKLLKNYDLILPQKSYMGCSVFEQYKKEHIIDDMLKIKDIILKKYPDYIKSFENIMNQNSMYFCNMFIGKSKIIKEYAKWVFDILFELEKQIKIDDRDDYQKRVFGFLSERLFNVWIDYHKKLKIIEKPVVLMEDSFLKTQVRRLKNIFKKS